MKEWSTCQSNYSIHNRHYGHCSWICLVVCSIAPSHLLWSLLLFCRAVAVFFRVHITNWCLPSVTPCRGLPSLFCALLHLCGFLSETLSFTHILQSSSDVSYPLKPYLGPLVHHVLYCFSVPSIQRDLEGTSTRYLSLSHQYFPIVCPSVHPEFRPKAQLSYYSSSLVTSFQIQVIYWQNRLCTYC